MGTFPQAQVNIIESSPHHHADHESSLFCYCQTYCQCDMSALRMYTLLTDCISGVIGLLLYETMIVRVQITEIESRAQPSTLTLVCQSVEGKAPLPAPTQVWKNNQWFLQKKYAADKAKAVAAITESLMSLSKL